MATPVAPRGGGVATSAEGGGSQDAGDGGGSDGGSGDAVACEGLGPDCVEGSDGICGDILFPPECGEDGVWRCRPGTVSPFECRCFYLAGLWCREGSPEACGETVDALCEDGWVCPPGAIPAEECLDGSTESGSDTGGTTGTTGSSTST